MSRLSRLVLTCCALLTTLVLTGCQKSEAPPQNVAPVADTDKDPELEEAKVDEAAFDALSPEDREAAKKQAVCLVTDEPLGSMGTPYKVTVKDQDVFLCCEGCKDTLNDDPDKFLAKLKK